jgi:hypothetical protein
MFPPVEWLGRWLSESHGLFKNSCIEALHVIGCYDFACFWTDEGVFQVNRKKRARIIYRRLVNAVKAPVNRYLARLCVQELQVALLLVGPVVGAGNHEVAEGC